MGTFPGRHPTRDGLPRIPARRPAWRREPLFRDRSGRAGCGSNGGAASAPPAAPTPAAAATPPAPPAAGVVRCGLPIRGRRSRRRVRLGDEHFGSAHGVRTGPGCDTGGGRRGCARGDAGAPAPTGQAAGSRLPLRIPGVRINFGAQSLSLRRRPTVGAGVLKFAGTATRAGVGDAAGLATLAGAGFGGGPAVPMVPGTWDTSPRAGDPTAINDSQANQGPASGEQGSAPGSASRT